ncbi:MAG: DUF1203 domain-containing protein [Alphaproteobacteria bacterium]|nr:DUF1203 domain-containing protein [Alphaproteobacteria bacterium]
MVQFVALDTEAVRHLQAGGADANGHIPERHISPGSGTPCRHCLQQVEEGEPFLIVAHRPFPEPQPYAEQGPIFLHARQCERHVCHSEVPQVLVSETYIVRGYDADNRIVYGTGKVVPTELLAHAATQIFDDEAIAYAHVRSAANNCYQCRIDRD